MQLHQSKDMDYAYQQEGLDVEVGDLFLRAEEDVHHVLFADIDSLSPPLPVLIQHLLEKHVQSGMCCFHPTHASLHIVVLEDWEAIAKANHP